MPHALFERRVAAECLSAGDTGRTFAVARVSMDVRLPFFGAPIGSEGLSSSAAAIVLAREAPPPNVLGEDGPEAVELLVASLNPQEVAELMERIKSAFRQIGLQVRSQVAWYPHDGRSAEVLLAPR